ncbi:MAG TPA: ANTAR domain-containing protein [Streptosporangiaceae bacterium]
MTSKIRETADAADSHHKPAQAAREDRATGEREAHSRGAQALSRRRAQPDGALAADSPPRPRSSTGPAATTTPGTTTPGTGSSGTGSSATATSGTDASGAHPADAVTSVPVPTDGSVARRTPQGWRIGEEEVPDLTSAMVLGDLLAAELAADSTGQSAEAPAAASGPAHEPAATGSPAAGSDTDSRKLARTVAQLEHALTARVRVEQAIGVLAERHRLRPRQAFDLLRSAARTRGKRVMEIASEVVDSATNPLLRIPEELARPPVTRRGGRIHRGTLESR